VQKAAPYTSRLAGDKTAVMNRTGRALKRKKYNTPKIARKSRVKTWKAISN